MTKSLLSVGFIQSIDDPSLFIKHANNTFIALFVYADDVIITSNSESTIQEVKDYLHSNFTIKDLGKLKYILGLEITRSKVGINICQRKHILDLLADYGFLECKAASTQITMDKQDYSQIKTLENISGYRQLIGKLLYLTNTSPDISFVVQQLSQHLEHPHEAHLTTAHRILRYLKGRPSLKVFYSLNEDTTLKAFTDLEWGNCKESRKSTT